MRRLLVGLMSAWLLMVCGGNAVAGPFASGPLVQASGTSPFAACAADNLPGETGTNFPNSEVEPWVDVNPANPANVVGIWQQDRWSDGGARGLVAGASFDGGTSWQQVAIPGLTLCTGGEFERASDPWLSFGPDGDLYQYAIVFNMVRNVDNAMVASKSTDGGRTWSDPITVIRDTDPMFFNDKQTITADPTDGDLVYAVWDRLRLPPPDTDEPLRGPTFFARTTDGGQSWEEARNIFDPGSNNQTIGNQIVVLPDGDLVNVFSLILNASPDPRRLGSNVAVIRSGSQGQRWSDETIVDRLGSIGVTDPESGEPVRTGDIIPDIAVDPDNGRLYVVWQDPRFNGGRADGIVLSSSSDGGRSWSTPVKVNATPTGVPIGDQQAFTPSVDVASDGTVAVSYYDLRNNDAGSPLLTDYWVVHCHPTEAAQCTSSEAFGDEVRLTGTSFDLRQAPNAGGFFLGDYVGLANDGPDFLTFFSQTHGDDPASVFARRARP